MSKAGQRAPGQTTITFTVSAQTKRLLLKHAKAENFRRLSPYLVAKLEEMIAAEDLRSPDWARDIQLAAANAAAGSSTTDQHLG